MATPPEGPTAQAANKAISKLDLDGHNLPPSPAPSSPQVGRRRYALATELVYTESKDQYGASSMPIYQSATFKQTSSSGGNEYDYTRSGNPTRTHLERHLAKIMNATRVLAVGSGMGALDVITRLLRPGDEVITGDDLYGGTNRLLTYLQANQGVVVHHVDTTDPSRVSAALTPRTAMVLLETPTNPLIKIVDIATIAAATHAASPRALVVVDNTMLSPMLCNPLDLGADVSYESGTKYLSGHHDIMAGVIALHDAALGDKMYFTVNATGCGLSPGDSFLLMRGVKTLAIRMEKQQANAQRIAEFLEGHGFRVRYPGLRSHPQYDLHWSMARGAGAVLSFETGDVGLSERVVEAARLWGISVSFGCVNSLISMPCRMSHASIDAKTREERQMPEDIIRLCVGIEDVNDLIDDLSRAVGSPSSSILHWTFLLTCPLARTSRCRDADLGWFPRQRRRGGDGLAAAAAIGIGLVSTASFCCSIGERGLVTFIFHTHRQFRFMVWQGSLLGKGKGHGAFMISRRLPRGTLVLIFQIKFVHGKWHPLGPFPRPPPCPGLPGRIVVVMVMKRGKAGVETGETKTEMKTGETQTRETKTIKGRQDEEGTLCCCGGRQSQQPSTHISTPLPLPVLQSSMDFPVSARHRREEPSCQSTSPSPVPRTRPYGVQQPR